MPFKIRIQLTAIFTLLCAVSYAQQTTYITGTVKDTLGKPLPDVSIAIVGQVGGTATDRKGNYSIAVQPAVDIILGVSSIGFETKKIPVKLTLGERKELNIVLKPTSNELPGVVIEDKQSRESSIMRIDPKVLSALPSASGNFESILKTLPGVTSNNELSSEYSVRGGNFDENLVYVNDIEIYRPFLVRSGQQEGLSFVNSDMVSSILFSAGGFDAKYGDKMSSVLAIKYKTPTKFALTASGSLLGSTVSLEGATKNHRLSYLLGYRQKTSQYLLNTLDTKGDYRPSFSDLQAFVNYQLNSKWDVSLLGNYSSNLYNVIPQNRTSTFGTVNEALQLRVYFDGQELDRFETFMGAASATYNPNSNLKLKFITSAFNSYEQEAFDIQGQYYIDELERDFGKSSFGQITSTRGVGTFLNHARTQLDALVYNAEHKGFYTHGRNYIQWGARIQHEQISDKINEWKLIDSAGYTLPAKPEEIELQEIIHTQNNISSNRYNAYLQNTYTLDQANRFTFTGGVRANYWDLNHQLLASPRASLSYKPQWKRDIVFRASSGVYHQPPFYREMRGLDGSLNLNLKAQQSIHFVLGSDFNFSMFHRPFKYVVETYYKKLDNLVPYKVDNVRVQYYGTNSSSGYATGIDMRLNGELVKGLESWASLSILQTREDIKDDSYLVNYNKAGEKIIPGYTVDKEVARTDKVNPGFIPRPSDQRFTFSMFIQDYLPKFPTYKVHLNFVFGTGLPFGPPGNDKYKDTLRLPPYRRVDIGFSKQIIGEGSVLPANMQYLKFFKSIWLSLEVFNLFDVNNTISYLWLKDVSNRQYAIPNYLTARQINVRLQIKL